MEMIPAIMATGAVLVGLALVGLILQIAYHVRSDRMAKQINHIEFMLNQFLIQDEIQIGQPATLEDLINLDLMETMGKVAPMTDRQVQEMVKELKND
jgi:hypothetical protein